MEERLEELRAEYERGVREMERLDRRRSELRGTLLRISGAVQVLEELIEDAAGAPEAAPTARAVGS